MFAGLARFKHAVPARLDQLRQDVALPGGEEAVHVRADLLHVHLVGAGVQVAPDLRRVLVGIVVTSHGLRDFLRGYEGHRVGEILWGREGLG